MEEEVESIVNKQQQQEKEHMEIEQMNMEEKEKEHMEEKCEEEVEGGDKDQCEQQCGEEQCEEEQCGEQCGQQCEQQCGEQQCEEMEQCGEQQCEEQCGEQQCEEMEECGEEHMEEWVCRVCHGESDDEHPLFHPCKCSGSIKYVHQDCLLEWLKVSNKSDPKCELCGTKFEFAKKYCDNTPERLSMFEFLLGIIPRFFSLVLSTLRGVTVVLCWIVAVPLWTWWMTRNTTLFLAEGVFLFDPFEMFWEWKSMLDAVMYWWNGCVVCAFIVITTLGVIQLYAFVREEINQSIVVESGNDEPGHGLATNHIPATNVTNDIDDEVNQIQPGSDSDIPDGVVETTNEVANVVEDILGAVEDDHDDTEISHRRDAGYESPDNENYKEIENSIYCEEENDSVVMNCSVDKVDEESVRYEEEVELVEITDPEISLAENTDDAQILLEGVLLDMKDANVVEEVEGSDEEEDVQQDEEVVDESLVEEGGDTERNNGVPQHLAQEWEFRDQQLQEENMNLLHMLQANQPQVEPPPLPPPQEHQRPQRHIPMHFDDDELVIEVGGLLSAPIWKTISEALTAWILTTIFVQSTLSIPSLLGRFFIFLLGFQKQIEQQCIGLVEMAEVAIQGDHSNITGKFADTPRSIFDFDSTATYSAETAIQLREAFVKRLVLGCEFFTGWVFIVVVLLVCFLWWLRRKLMSTTGRHSTITIARLRERIRFCLQQVRNHTKSAFFSCLDWTIIPQLMGFVIDIITVKAFGSNVSERIAFCREKPLLGVAIHFMVGFSFIAHVNVFTSELRRILKENVLVNILPEQSVMDDYAFEVMGQPVMKLVQRTLLTLFYCIPAILLMIMLPVSFGHYFFPFATPLQLHFNDLYFDIQLPLEMLMFQFLLPFLARRVSHRKSVRYIISRYMVYACQTLGLHDLLDEEEMLTVLRRGFFNISNNIDNEVHVQPFIDAGEGSMNDPGDGSSDDVVAQQRGSNVSRKLWKFLKCIVLVVFGLFLLFLVSVWCIHAPITVGRQFLAYLGLSIENDLYCICLGFSIIVSAGVSLKFMVNEISQSATAVVTLCFTWFLLLVKILVVSLLVFGVAPLLLGLLVAVVVIIPLRTPHNESPAYPLLQCWAIGLLFFCFWLRAVMVGAFGENYYWLVRFNVCVRAGFVGMDLSFIVRKIMIPIFLYLLDRLIVPYFFARTLGLCLTQSYTLRTLIMRYSFVVYYVSRLIVVGIRFAREYVGRMHTEILDSRYLVGTELTNRQ